MKNPCDTCENRPDEYYAPHICKGCIHWEKSYYYKNNVIVFSQKKHEKKKKENEKIVSEIIKKHSHWIGEYGST